MVNDSSSSKKKAWEILGISVNSDQEQIRRAYLEKVKQHAPDKDPEEFERIRDAYTKLRDSQGRTRQLLLMVDPRAAFTTLLESDSTVRLFTGSALWWKVLKQKRRIGERDA